MKDHGEIIDEIREIVFNKGLASLTMRATLRSYFRILDEEQ